MFGIFKSKEQKSAEKFWKSEMGQRLTALNAEYFGRGGICEILSPEVKQKFCGWLLQRIFGVYESADPFAAMRKELAAMAACDAELVILLDNPVDDPRNAWMRSRYISNELHLHRRSCVPHITACPEVAEALLQDPNMSDDNLRIAVRARWFYYNYSLNGVNLLRYDFDDFAGGKDRDWLMPFNKSMLIWEEYLFRSKIGLPSLFEDKIPAMAALPHSNFFDLVNNGARNPLFEWESKWGKHEQAC